MRILAIETSGRHGSLAALETGKHDEQLLQQIALNESERTAKWLAPSLRELLKNVGWKPTDVDLVAVAVGPGSFTGLRIGVTTAKTFAYAADAEIIGVNTLVAMAAQVPAADQPLWTILDAQRGEVFAAKFHATPLEFCENECAVSIMRQEDWLIMLRPGDRVTGPVLGRLASRLPAGVAVMAGHLWQPMAEAVGRVASCAYRAGVRHDVWQLKPHYYRPSYAEEKKK